MLNKQPIPKEKWLPIKNYEGLYEVSNLGRVRGLKRIIPGGGPHGPVLRAQKARIIKPYFKPKGYGSVSLQKHQKRTVLSIHRLVATAFIGDCPSGLECAHMDGNPTNNNVENLAWVTLSENQHHRKIHGTSNCGERQWKTKLTDVDVLEMLARHKTGELYKSIAKDYQASPKSVYYILAGYGWNHLRNGYNELLNQAILEGGE